MRLIDRITRLIPPRRSRAYRREHDREMRNQALRDLRAAQDDAIRVEGRIREARSRAVAYGATDNDLK